MNLLNKTKSNEIIEQEEITWETVGDELFFKKNKFSFTTEEITLIKNLLKDSPPPLQYRRKVIIINIIIIINIVMVNKFRSSSRNA